MGRLKENIASGKYTKTIWSLVMLSSVIGLTIIANRHPLSEGMDFLSAFGMGMFFTVGLSYVVLMQYALKSMSPPTPTQKEDENTTQV